MDFYTYQLRISSFCSVKIFYFRLLRSIWKISKPLKVKSENGTQESFKVQEVKKYNIF